MRGDAGRGLRVRVAVRIVEAARDDDEARLYEGEKTITGRGAGAVMPGLEDEGAQLRWSVRAGDFDSVQIGYEPIVIAHVEPQEIETG